MKGTCIFIVGGGGGVFRGVKGKEKNEVKEGKGRVGYI
jgi:uridylate kinase